MSLCLIVKDEEANLPDCLGPVAGLFDEVVVVDTGSKDRTKEVAAGLGAKVYDFPWVDSFAAARNESLSRAAGDWAFWLDADDRLDGDNRRKLRALLDSLRDVNAAYVMKCACVSDGASGSATVVDHVRLFRNRPDVRWQYRVHEQILPALRRTGADVRWSDVVIRHVGYADPALRGRKLERDLRLLRLEDAERPGDPFTLFNLGSVYQELGRHQEALAYLRRSLAKSHPSDSIVRKLYALMAGCHRTLGQHAEALAACRDGRRHYPDDAELLFLEALLLREAGNLPTAEVCLLRLLAGREGQHFASVDAGLRGHKARHNLAVLYHQQGRHGEATAQWRAAVDECPGFTPAWLGLGEACLARGDWTGLEEAAARLEGLEPGTPEAAVLRARGLLARRDFAAARALLDEVIRAHPQALGPRVALSHLLLQEGRDPAAAEQALRDVLLLDPGHREALHNLSVLLGRGQLSRDEVFAGDWALAELYRRACATPSEVREHLPVLHGADADIRGLYCATPSEVREHLPVLHELAKECKHATALGAGDGLAAKALLAARLAKLVWIDRVRPPAAERLQALAGPATEFAFRQESDTE